MQDSKIALVASVINLAVLHRFPQRAAGLVRMTAIGKVAAVAIVPEFGEVA